MEGWLLRFLKKVRAVIAGPVIDIKTGKEIKDGEKGKKGKLSAGDLKAKPGDVFEIVEGADPHRDGRNETVYITVAAEDGVRPAAGDFYYFHGKGKPEKNFRIFHSNMFVWGIVSFKKIAHVPFKSKNYAGFKWTETGIPKIDEQLANHDARYALFEKLAPEKYKDKYSDQEDRNYHHENAKMVAEFADWVSSGKEAGDFGKGKKKA